MKKILLTMVMALALAGVASAQDNDRQKQGQRPDPAQMAQRMTEQMVKKYGLDSKQEASLLELNKQYAGKMPMMGGPRGGRPGGRPGMGGGQPGMRGGQPGGNRPDSAMARRQRPSKEEMDKRMKEMQANREAYNAGVKKIMTKKQYKQFTADQEKMRQRGHRQGNGGKRQD